MTGTQAEGILRQGRADLVCIAREALRNPHWAQHAVQELGGDRSWSLWPPQYGRKLFTMPTRSRPNA